MGHNSLLLQHSHNSTLRLLGRKKRWHQSGFSLIEVLVSIVVLSFGLLGMVGMQAAALQANREARLQSSAVVLARELAEMVRGNKDSVARYLGDFTSSLTPTTASSCLNVASVTACASKDAVANAQMTEWLGRVGAELPGAKVRICADTAPFDTTTGLPVWACTGTGTDGVVVVKIGWTKGSTNRSLTGNSALDKATIPSIVLPVTAGDPA